MEFDKLKKKYFPRVPWTAGGPVRRVYLARAAEGSVLGALRALGEREGFTAPGEETVTGGPEACRAAFERKAAGQPVGLIFGVGAAAHWCDLAAEEPDEEGWQRVIVRSEEGENLTALAHNEGLLRFRKAT